MSNIKDKKQKGVSLYLALIIMAILLAITLGLSTISVSQMKITREMGYSVAAFYAADTGIERALYDTNCTSTCVLNGFLDLDNDGQDNDDSTYNVSGMAAGTSGCPIGINYCIKSVGIFKQVQRAIQIEI